MTISDDRLLRYQRNRAARLGQRSWIHSDTAGGYPARYVAGELLVLEDHHSAARDVLTSLGHRADAIHDDEAIPGLRRLRVTDLRTSAAIRLVRQRAGAGAAGPNHVFLSSPYEHGGPFGPPEPTDQAYTAREQTATNPVRITVVDTGVWLDSPLPRNAYEATDADLDDTLDDDDSDVAHANFIAGVILAATDQAHLRIVKVLDADGVCTEYDLARALLALPDSDVVNLSLGGYTLDNSPPVLLAAALGQLLGDHDRVVVAAAGNDGRADQPFWPAAFAANDASWADQVIAVAAHDGKYLCNWSNTGDWVSIAAPGCDITSTYVRRPDFSTGMAQWSGTSFAAPYVAAAIASRREAAGSIAAAVKQLRQDAGSRRYNNYPGLA
jgi:thermitase